MTATPSAIRCLLSTPDGHARLTEQATPPALPDAAGLPRLWVDPSRRFQTLEGFGGAFTEAAAVTWLALDTQARRDFLRDYFDPQQGHGYTLCRVHMNSCDFALGNYAHVETPGDVELSSFSIERDRRALLPFIRAAQQAAGQPLQLLASPWSPPAWMKSNGQMNHGGQLLPQFRAAWAQCFVRFIQAYAAEGVPIWGVTVQNEPEATQRWDSCLYTAEEERDFVRDDLGPALAAAGLEHVKILIWDHNRDRLVERTSVVYADAEASRYVWGAGFHWYGEDHFEQLTLTHDAWPDKQLLFTEGCQEGGPHTGEWALAERYAHSMINDLNRWTVGWIDWNLLLDDSGGPNHVGNLCSAPVLADRASGALWHQSSYWAIGHFARFVRPGAQRVLCTASKQALHCTAFANPDGSVVVVAMNRSDEDLAFALRIDSLQSRAVLPARSIATFIA
ncbi:MAG: glycoside hydrolase family 30 protein [Burkholderiales bacterium]|nr:glycoside hydrolase family 30 protein [Burkholderiales bacterium]